MEKQASHNDLHVAVNNKQILSIALPITLAILIPQLNLLINSVFLGQLSKEALGNAGITGVFFLIFALAGNGLNNALQTVFSRYAGADKPEAFGTILSQGIRISLQFALFGIAFTWLLAPIILGAVTDPVSFPEEMKFLKIIVLGLPFLYLFQMGNAFLVSSLNSRLLMVGFLTEALVNILFDYLLIFGKFGFPNLGFSGAAVATVLAEISGLLAVWLVMYKKGLLKKYSLLQNLTYNKKVSKEVFTVAVPLVLQYMISVTTWLIFFLLIETKGVVAKAVSNTIRNVYGLAGIFVWAFSSTCNTMVSNLVGQGKTSLVIPLINRITYWSAGSCFIICGLLNIFPGAFFKLFGQDDAFVAEGIPVIRVVSVGIFFLSIALIWLNGVTGTGKTKVNLLIEIIAIVIYLCYTFYFMKLHYISLAVAWTNEFVYWSSVFLMSFLYMKSNRWKGANAIVT